MKRRIVSIITALALCLSLCPTWAFAAESEIVPDDEVLADERDLCTHGELVDECPLCPIEALIAALPRALTEANRAEVEAQLQEILDIWRELSEDEQNQIDMTLCWGLLAALDPANTPMAADGHTERQANDEASVDIGGSITYYSTLEEAFAAANRNTATITMLMDAECSGGDFNNPSPLVVSGGTVTLDMNGQTLSGYGFGTEGAIIGVSGGSLTVQGGGTVKIIGVSVGIICTGGTLTVADTTFNLVGANNSLAISAVQNGSLNTGKGGTVTINGATITGAASGGQIYHYAGTTIINNMVTTDDTRGVFHQNDSTSSGKLTITGGTFNNTIAIDENTDGIQSVEALLGDGYAYKHQGGTWATDDDLAGLTISNVTVEKIPLTIKPYAETSWYYNSGAHNLQMNAAPATAGETITYEWYDDSTKLDCTADAYPVPETTAVGNYSYTCKATCDGYTLSHEFTFTVAACPHTGLVYEPQENNKHGGTCPDCGTEVLEEHTWADGVCSVCNLKAVAKVESGNATTYYGDLDPAWTAAYSAQSAKVTLLANVTETWILGVDDGQQITLNGGIYTHSILGFNVYGGQLDITGGTFQMCNCLEVSGGTVRLSGGEFISTTGNVVIVCYPGSGLTVDKFLAEGCAYYQDGQPIAMTGQTSLSGTVTVGVCTHPEALQDQGNGTHSGNCPYCGTKFEAESHTLGAGNKCEGCGATLKVKVEIGGTTTYYGTIDAAWEAVENVTSAEITLLDHVTTESLWGPNSGQNITFNGGIFEYTSTQALLSVAGHLTVNSGTFIATGGGQVALNVGPGGTATLNGGTFTGTGGSYWFAIRSQDKPVSEFLGEGRAYCDANGQPIAMTGQTELPGTVTVQECEHDASVCKYQPLDGGTSHKKTCLACGMTWDAEPHTLGADNRCAQCEAELVAQVNDACYSDIKAAWGAACTADAATLTLLRDVETGDMLYVNSGNITFDGGNYTLKGTNPALAVNVSGGTLTVVSGTISGGHTCVNITDGVLVVKGGKIETSDYEGINVAGGTAIISGGEVRGSSVGVTRGRNAELTISGGTFYCLSNGIAVNILGGKVGEVLLNYGDASAEAHYAFYRDGKPYKLPDGGTLPGGTFTVQQCKEPLAYTHASGTTKHTQSCQYCGAGNSETDCSFTWTDDTGECVCGATLVVNVSEVELTYDGTEKKPGVTVTLDGTDLDTSKYSIAYDGNVNAGTDIASVTVSGTGWSYTKSFTIKPATLTITANDQTITYGQSIPQGTDQVTAIGLCTGDSIASIALTASSDQVLVEGKTITPSGASIKNSGGQDVTGNYNIKYETGSLTINRSTPTIAFVIGYNLDKTYDGQTIANPTANNLDITGAEFKDVEFAWKQNGTAASPLNAGSYTLTATIPETTNTAKAEATLTVTISPKAVTADSNNIILTPSVFEFNGTAREPEVVIRDGTLTIPAGEYTVSYSNNINVGQATVTITDNSGGNYTVNGSTTFQITKRSLSNAAVTVSGTYTYNGEAQTPTEGNVSVVLNGTTIDPGEYTIDATNNTNAGEATVTITATADGDYSGSANGKFTIAQASLTIKANDQTIAFGESLDNTAVTYTGLCSGDILESVILTASSNQVLVEGKTITPSAASIKNSGGQDVTGNYEIAYEKGKLTITPVEVKLTFTDQTITYGDTPKQATADPASAVIAYSYTGTSSGNGWPTNAGTYTVTAKVEANGNYGAASETATLTINPKTVSATVAAEPDSYVYTGEAIIPTKVVVKDGNTVIPASEYTVEYSNNTNVGIATVTITDKDDGNYTVSGSTTFTITAKPLTGASVNVSGTFTYSGNAHTPDPTVTLGGRTLTKDTDYTVSYSDNVDAGTATITITGKDNYSGTASGTFTIGRATLTADGTGIASGTYGKKLSELEVTGLTAKMGDTVVNGSWALTGETIPDVGDSKTYTATFTPASGAGNYETLTAQVTLNISKVDYTGIKTANTSAKFGLTKTYDLKDLLPAGYELGTVTVSDSNSIFDGTPSVSGTTLTYKLVDNKNNVDKTGDIIIPVTSSTNYNAFDLTITVTVTNVQVPDLKVNPISVTYTGSPVPDSSISGTATVDGQPISGTWSFVEGQNITNVSDSGTKQVRFTPGNTDLYGPNTGTVTVTISKATPSLSLTASPVTLPNGGTVTLTLSDLPAGGSATVTCSDANISVTKGSGNTWTADLPAGGASYTFTASYAGDGNHNSATANCTVSVEKITPTLSLTAAPDSLTGGGTVTLTLTGLPTGGTATVTCPNGITVTVGAGNTTWTAILPNSTATYTFTASYAGNDSYHAASASCTVTTTEVVILPNPPAGDENTQFQLVMETTISEVPEGLKDIESLNTPEKLILAMKTAITEANSGVNQANTAVYDVELMVSTNGGSTWTPATKENFPSGGLVITLPYPEGTNSSYKFTVVHMFTSSDFGKRPGDTETPAVTNTADGIRFTVTGLSPISIGWVQSTTPTTPTGPSISNPGGGGSVSTYAITVEKSEHGKVTSNRVNASSGSTVTLTVTPDSGYILDTLTVTDSRGNEIKLTAQGGGKYTFTMPSRAVTVKATFAPLPADVEQPCDGGAACPSHGFTDLGTVGTWYHEAVDYVLRNGLMNGYSSTMFGPNDNLSRAQLAQILYNKEGKPLVTSGSVFTDVADGQWYAPAITWAAANGIVGGYGNGRFGPDDNITREQLAVMLWRYAGSPAATDKELHFTDADQASGYALEALRWAAANGILNGYGDGRLNPGGLATRAQVAQMLKNFLEQR